MTTAQSIKKAITQIEAQIGHVSRNEFLLALSDPEISTLLAAKIRIIRGFKPAPKRRVTRGRQTQFNF